MLNKPVSLIWSPASKYIDLHSRYLPTNKSSTIDSRLCYPSSILTSFVLKIFSKKIYTTREKDRKIKHTTYIRRNNVDLVPQLLSEQCDVLKNTKKLEYFTQ
jgi:hypothetical protein